MSARNVFDLIFKIMKFFDWISLYCLHRVKIDENEYKKAVYFNNC